MNQRPLSLLALLLAITLLIGACQAPFVAPAATPVQEQATDTPVTEVEAEAEAVETEAEVEAEAEAQPQAEANADPLAVDPDRPGFTLDGSPTLGAADAPIVIIDFSDFQ